MLKDLVYHRNTMEINKKRLAVLGSTGSIGQQTLDVVRNMPGWFEVIGISAGENIHLLKKQIEEFHPKLVACLNPEFRPGGQDFKIALPQEIASHPEVDRWSSLVPGSPGWPRCWRL
jgi:1-deoxy-D-xylulose-5-phosphate reductoisomerase